LSLFANYESYYQGDGSGDFSKNNVQFKKDTLTHPKPKWSIFGHLIFNGNREIVCGPIKLFWSGRGAVYHFRLQQPQGDHGIELAPTPWSNVSEVNVFDPRITWYRYDEKRKRVNIPIDQLWKNKEVNDKRGQAYD
jgi:hypothetical protein